MPFLNNEGLEVVKEIFNAKFAGKNADGAVVSVGADYAEFADWADGNPGGADRKGHFVTVVSGSNDIEIANSASAITGVITDSAGFIGNYTKGAESDASKGLVGIIGQITVIDNGTCEVGQRCMPTDDGTAVPSDNTCGYKVIDRVDSTHVKIMVAPALDMIQRIRTDVGELQDGAPYYSLGLGCTEIPANADLNAYRTPGMYGKSYATNNVANCPNGTADEFILVVRNGLVSDFVIQEFYSYAGASDSAHYTRHFINGSWSSWKCSGGVDSIVAEGISGMWYWVKYANGTAECWLYAGLEKTAHNYMWGSFYAYNHDFNFPFSFTTTPTALVSGNSGANQCFVSYAAPDLQKIRVIMCRSGGGSCVFGYSIHVIGRWK